MTLHEEYMAICIVIKLDWTRNPTEGPGQQVTSLTNQSLVEVVGTKLIFTIIK